MQEQPRYNITPDEAWSKMHAILDAELPVIRRTRRLAFLWRFASAALITTVMVLLLYKGLDFNLSGTANQPLDSNSSSQHEKPVLGQSDLLNNDGGTEAPVQQVTQSALPDEPSNDPIQNAQRAKTSKQNQPSSQTPPQPERNKQKIQSIPMAAVQHKSEGYIAESENFNNEKASMEWSTDVTSILTSRERSATYVASIPSRMISCIDHEPSPVNMNISPVVKKSPRKQSLFEPSLAVSGMTGQHGGTGIYGGAGLGMQLSRRISIQTQIGYRTFQPGASLFGKSKVVEQLGNPILLVDPYNGFETYINGQALNAEAAYNVVSPFVESVHQWQWSGGLTWNVSRRLFAEGGIMVGFATKARSEYPILSGDFNSTPDLRTGNSLNAYDVIRSTMTSIYGGIGYHIGEHIDVFAQWTHGMESYLLNGTAASSGVAYPLASGKRSDYIRGFGLGVKYIL